MFAEIASAIFGGGATGLLGAAINKVADYFAQKRQFAHEETMAEIEIKRLQMRIDRDVKIAEEETEARKEEAAAETQQKSYAGDSRQYITSEAVSENMAVAFLMGVVDFIRGLVRPALTIWLSIVAWLIYQQTQAVVESSGQALTGDQAFDLMKTITLGLLYLTFTAVGWWFGSRGKFEKVMT